MPTIFFFRCSAKFLIYRAIKYSAFELFFYTIMSCNGFSSQDYLVLPFSDIKERLSSVEDSLELVFLTLSIKDGVHIH